MKPSVLLMFRQTECECDNDQFVRCLGLYTEESALRARLERIAAVNPKYPLVELSSRSWRIGPEEPEGFFGDRIVVLQLVEVNQ